MALEIQDKSWYITCSISPLCCVTANRASGPSYQLSLIPSRCREEGVSSTIPSGSQEPGENQQDGHHNVVRTVRVHPHDVRHAQRGQHLPAAHRPHAQRRGERLPVPRRHPSVQQERGGPPPAPAGDLHPPQVGPLNRQRGEVRVREDQHRVPGPHRL